MMGMQFETTAGQPIKLSDINFGGMTGPKYDDGDAFLATAPQIQISNLNSEGFSGIYYFLADGAPNFIDPGWTDNGGNPIDADKVVIDPSVGFWFRDPGATSDYNPAGQIVPDSPFVKPVGQGEYRQLVCPFPVAVSLADIDFGDIAKTAPEYGDGSSFLNMATQIQIPNDKGDGWVGIYYFLSDGAEDFTNPGWTDNGGNPVDETKIILPAGRGCWFKANADLNVTFTLSK